MERGHPVRLSVWFLFRDLERASHAGGQDVRDPRWLNGSEIDFVDRSPVIAGCNKPHYFLTPSRAPAAHAPR